MLRRPAILVDGVLFEGHCHGDALRKAEDAGKVKKGSKIEGDLFVGEQGELIQREATRNMRLTDESVK